MAAGLLAAGDEVEILSPDPRSAAHRHARLSGPMLAVQLALRARHFDALVLNVEPGLPLAASADRATRAVTLAALGAALRRYREVTVRLPSPLPIPGGVGGRATRELWARATTIVVENDDDRDRLVVAPGVTAGRVVVAPPPPPPGAASGTGWGQLVQGEGDLRSAVQALVRERAARDRMVNGARRALGGGALPDASDDPFTGEVGRPPALAPLELARLGVARARRVALKLVRSVQAARSSS